MRSGVVECEGQDDRDSLKGINMEQFAVIRFVNDCYIDKTLFCGSYNDCLKVIRSLKSRKDITIMDIQTGQLVSWVLK